MPEDLATVREAREALRACEERNTGGWIDCLERTTRLANTVIAQDKEIQKLREERRQASMWPSRGDYR